MAAGTTLVIARMRHAARPVRRVATGAPSRQQVGIHPTTTNLRMRRRSDQHQARPADAALATNDKPATSSLADVLARRGPWESSFLGHSLPTSQDDNGQELRDGDSDVQRRVLQDGLRG